MSNPNAIDDASNAAPPCPHVFEVTYYGDRCIRCGYLEPDVAWEERDGCEAEGEER